MNETDRSFLSGALWIMFVIVVLLMGYASSEASEEHRYQEDNATGLYYLMTWDCEVFNPETGYVLDDDNETKCKLYMYKDGHPIRKATPDELQREIEREKQRERMYDEG